MAGRIECEEGRIFQMRGLRLSCLISDQNKKRLVKARTGIRTERPAARNLPPPSVLWPLLPLNESLPLRSFKEGGKKLNSNPLH